MTMEATHTMTPTLNVSMLGQREQEFAFAPTDFKRIASLLHSETGISLPESKMALVYSRLARRLRSTNCASFADYFELITSDQGDIEQRKMCSALTTNVTDFFREPHHFSYLRETVLPPLLEAARQGQRVRIWSAACSTGEEPYSIALEILSLMPDAGKFDIKILATDICPDVVETARKGTYSSVDVRTVPTDLLQRWFHLQQGVSRRDFKVCDDLRQLVHFHELNLVGDWPMRGPFQIVFCRNVVIYFDASTTQHLWGRFSNLLAPDGHLFIGHSERIEGSAARLFKSTAVTTYSKVSGAMT